MSASICWTGFLQTAFIELGTLCAHCLILPMPQGTYIIVITGEMRKIVVTQLRGPRVHMKAHTVLY